MPLYLVATPIGNLSDISSRALETLRSSEMILCEDTRTSLPLLHHYEIRRPLRSYHKFNETAALEQILELLTKGASIALISDAGTPCISDPGGLLVRHCRQQQIPVFAIPGACAPICALVCSGLDCSRFQFLGFTPKLAHPRRLFLQKAVEYEAVSIFFETASRLIPTLEQLAQLCPEREVALLKELTKYYEQHWLAPAKSLYEQLLTSSPKGEWVLLLAGHTKPPLTADLKQALDHLQALQAKGLSRRDSVAAVSLLLNVDSQELYRHLGAT